MLSNKLTFSLASLIVLLVFAFATTSVMAADGGPTVTITDAGTTAAPSTRAAFKVKFTFSEPVGDFTGATGDATFQVYDKDGVRLGTETDIDLSANTVVASPDGTMYTATINLATVINALADPEDPADAVGVYITGPEDAATGTTENNIGNVRKVQGLPLPPSIAKKVEIVATKDPADTNAADGQTYDLTITFMAQATVPDPALTDALITIEPEYLKGAMPVIGITGTAAANYVYTAEITHPAGAPTVTIGLVPSYVAAANVTKATIPPPANMSKPATAKITVPNLNEDAKTFQVEITFAGGKKTDGSAAPVMDFGHGMLEVKDKNGATLSFSNPQERSRDNYYGAVLPYLDLDMLPFTVKAVRTSNDDPTKIVYYKDTSDPTMDAMAKVGEDMDAVPAAPANLAATAGVGKITVSWAAVTGSMYQYSKDASATWMDATSPLEVMGPAGTEISVMVRVKASGNMGPGRSSITSATPTAAAPGGGGKQPDDKTPSNVTVSSGSGTGTLTLAGSIAKNGFAVISAKDLLDLNAFFREGGTISLIAKKGTGATARTAKDVVISEILWGLDQSKGTTAERKTHQFIELYNTTGAAIDLTGAMLSFDDTSVVPTDPGADSIYLDQVSNAYLAGWVVDNDDKDQGQSGRLSGSGGDFTPTDIVSMYRNIDYPKVEKAGSTRADQLKDFPDGKVQGSWAKSTKFYMAGIIASKGEKHIVPVEVLTPTDVPYEPVIINEIGNLEGEDNDWIELRAVADANLKKYELAYIQKGVEKTLVQFPDKDYKLTAGQILLIVNKDPRDTVLARGKKFGDADGITPDIDQEERGVSHKVSMFYDAKGGLKEMPEEGKFLLVLRSEAKNNHEKIIDLVGTDFHADPSKDYRTALFPLKGAGAGHGNVIDGGGEEAFDAPGAYKRNDAKGGTGEKDFGSVGYTGIGYDRKAPSNGDYGGTPGFPNDALKEKGLASDTITISEVMVNSRGNRYPQWIELRNSSSTNGVNLNGWKLRVENVSDTGINVRRNFNIDLSGHIPPNRTILVVTRRTSTHSSTIQESQLINLNTADMKKVLEAEQSRFTILSTDGFTLELFEKDQKTREAKPVDTITVAADQLTEEKIGTSQQRISLVRAYLDKSPDNLLSADESLQIATEGSYYGAQNDISTPGNHRGSALPVSLSSFRPVRDKATGAVAIRWITQSELNNAGFNILRSETKTGEFKVVNVKGIIPGHGTTSEKHVYEWTDTTAKPNVVYYYQIEDVSLDGERTTLRTTHLRGNVNAAGKVTTTWGDLKTQN